MDNNKEHNRTQSQMPDSNFFKNGTFYWKKTQEEVWADIEGKLNSSDEGEVRKLGFNPKMISIAASVTIIIGLVSVLRFYSVSTYTTPGMHSTTYLPDGSTVQLNAASKLTYYPLWWKFKRIIKFKGEGFFEVQKGNKFVVHTLYGDVEVLGTSFNVFARKEAPRVSCLTGRVRVTSKNQSQVVLLPNSKAELLTNKNIKVSKDINVENDIAWRKNYFRFESEPLKNVFLEIERQYGVKLEMDFSGSATYSGNFQKKERVEDILNYVCSPMGLTFKKKSDNEYIILQE